MQNLFTIKGYTAFVIENNISQNTLSPILFTANIKGIYVINIPHLGGGGVTGSDQYVVLHNDIICGASAENQVSSSRIPAFTNTFIFNMNIGDTLKIKTLDKEIQLAGCICGVQILNSI